MRECRFTLSLDFGVLGTSDVDFVVDYRPGTPDVMYLSNGDPGYPGDPEELSVTSAHCNAVDITYAFDWEAPALYDAILEKARETAQSEQEDRRAEYESGQAELRRLEEDAA